MAIKNSSSDKATGTAWRESGLAGEGERSTGEFSSDRRVSNYTFGGGVTDGATEAQTGRDVAAAGAAGISFAGTYGQQQAEANAGALGDYAVQQGGNLAAQGQLLGGEATAYGQNAAAGLGAYGGQVASDLGAYSGQAAADLSDYSGSLANRVARSGQNNAFSISGAGSNYADPIVQEGSRLVNYGQSIGRNAGAAQYRAGVTADFGAANQMQASALGSANALTGIEADTGPSAAQALLQSGLNQSAAQNLALARSGRGFGGSASALTQAAGLNAAAGQTTVNQAAILRANEVAAQRQRAAQNLQAAGGLQLNSAGQSMQQATTQAGLTQQQRVLNDQQQIALQGQSLQGQQAGLQAQLGGAQLGVSAATDAARLNQQGMTDAAQLGLQGNTSASQLGLQGQTSASQLGLQGMTDAAQLGTQATLGGNTLNMQGQQAGATLGLQGLGDAGQLALQGSDLDLQGQQAATNTMLTGEQLAGNAYGQELGGNVSYEQNETTREGVRQGVVAQQQAADKAFQQQLLGAGISGVGAMIGAA